jgi:hypothetical protein
MTADTPSGPAMTGSSAAPHRLELELVELVGGGREVHFRPGLNIIQGNITTGKSTFVRLLRGLLGTLPDNLPPEVDDVTTLQGRVLLETKGWVISRPRTSTASALVEVIEDTPAPGEEPEVLRFPVSGQGVTYSTFMLDELSIPRVSVPTARTRPTESLTPVTMTDWLGYCIIPGDELDTQVFGHHLPFRDGKRRWVFQLTYGYYDSEVARLAAELRSMELRLEAMDREAEVREKFLAETPFADETTLVQQLEERREELADVRLKRMGVSHDATQLRGVSEVRTSLLSAQTRFADVANQAALIEAQIKDLEDLTRQLESQADRLTRAVVAGEWLVDFDFVVCPRCGNDVNAGRGGPNRCYLCLQEPLPAPSREQLLAEQSRINSQISETQDVISTRTIALSEVRHESRKLEYAISQLSTQLNELTDAFVSERAALLEQLAAGEARIETDIIRLSEYQTLLNRHRHQLDTRGELERLWGARSLPDL